MDDIFFSIAGACIALFFLAMTIMWIFETISRTKYIKANNNELKREIDSLRADNEKAEEKRMLAEKKVIELMAERAKLMHPVDPNIIPITAQCCCHNIEAYVDATCDDRWDKATSGDIIIKNLLIHPNGVTSEDLTPGKINIINIHAKIYSKQSDRIYTTSLTQCDCESFKYRNKESEPYVCKHMLTLAIETDAIPFLKK